MCTADRPAHAASAAACEAGEVAAASVPWPAAKVADATTSSSIAVPCCQLQVPTPWRLIPCAMVTSCRQGTQTMYPRLWVPCRQLFLELHTEALPLALLLVLWGCPCPRTSIRACCGDHHADDVDQAPTGAHAGGPAFDPSDAREEDAKGGANRHVYADHAGGSCIHILVCRLSVS
jgi:hypothetical protein